MEKGYLLKEIIIIYFQQNKKREYVLSKKSLLEASAEHWLNNEKNYEIELRCNFNI